MDASVYEPVTDMLRQLGWNIETAKEAGLTGKIDDTKWIVHARKVDRIAITFDELRAKQGAKISRELRRHGGKVVKVNGKLDEYRAIGKLLYHFNDWCQFLKNNNGISVLADMKPQGCKNFTPEAYHHHYHRTDAELFIKYLKRRKNRLYHPRKRKPRPLPDNQGILT